MSPRKFSVRGLPHYAIELKPKSRSAVRAETEEPQRRPLAVYIELLVSPRFGRRENISLIRQPRQNELKSPVRLKRRNRIHAFAHDTTSYA